MTHFDNIKLLFDYSTDMIQFANELCTSKNEMLNENKKKKKQQ